MSSYLVEYTSTVIASAVVEAVAEAEANRLAGQLLNEVEWTGPLILADWKVVLDAPYEEEPLDPRGIAYGILFRELCRLGADRPWDELLHEVATSDDTAYAEARYALVALGRALGLGDDIDAALAYVRDRLICQPPPEWDTTFIEALKRVAMGLFDEYREIMTFQNSCNSYSVSASDRLRRAIGLAQTLANYSKDEEFI